MKLHRRPAPIESMTTSTEKGSVSLVDEALRVAIRRQFFTRDEVLGLLRRIELDTRGEPGAANVERIVVGVDVGSADQDMLSRTDLVDPLLDIRLALCT